jgi:mRNA interferase RelE/StbE
MSLSAQVATRVYAAIEKLPENPRPPGCVKLKFAAQAYRIRIGDHRVIYEVRAQELIVTIVRVAERDEATYSGL